MSFLAILNHDKDRTVSLRAGKYINRKPERISLFIPSKGQRASISIEAAMVVPFFLFFVLNLISIISILSSYSRVQAAVTETGMKLADYAYIKDKGDDLLPFELEILPDQLMSVFAAKELVEQQIGREYLSNMQIKDKEDGLQFLYTQILQDEEDMVDIVVHYSVSPMFGMAGFGRFHLVNRCRVKGFTGYKNDGDTTVHDGEEIVYITESGSAYHRVRSCSYLKLSIKTILPSLVEQARNENGGKYHSCDICKKVETRDIFYITEQGDRFHNTINCSGLKRTVIEIFLTKVGGRTPCTRCTG